MGIMPYVGLPEGAVVFQGLPPGAKIIGGGGQPPTPSGGFSVGEYTDPEVTPEESERYGRATLETIGAAGGGVLGTAALPVAGTIAGETIGYTAGARAGDYLYGPRKDSSLGKDLATGAFFSAVPMAGTKVLDKLGRGAIRSAIKIPPTQVKKEVAEGVVGTIVDEGMRVGKGGIEKGYGIIRDVEKQLDSLLRKSGSEIDVNRFTSAIENMKTRFKYSSNPSSAEDILDSVAQEAMNHPLVRNGKIPIKEAQKLKKGLYKELKGFYSNLQSLAPKEAIKANAESIGKAAWAESLRNSIMKDTTIPKEGLDWLKREANVINAVRWIERRANVAANMDPITFNDVLLGGLIREGVPFAVASRVLRMPAVLSQIGIWASRSKVLRSPMTYGGIAAKGYLSDNTKEVKYP